MEQVVESSWYRPGRSVPLVGALVLAAILLVHLFATPDLDMGQMLAHALTIALGYTLGFALAYIAGAQLWLRFGRPGAPPAWYLALIVTGGFAVGLALLLGLDATGLSGPDGSHRDPSWLLRLMPVGVALILLFLLAERSRQLRQELTALGSTVAAPASEGEAIELHDGRRMVLARRDEILGATAQENYCEVTLADGQNLLIRSTLADLLARLPQPPFARTHRSHLVNLAAVRAIEPAGRSFVAMLADGKTRLPVSRSEIEAVAAAWRGMRAVD